MIKLRDFNFEIKKDLEIKIEYRDRIINKESIECVQEVKSNKNYYAVDMRNKEYCYHGYILDENDKIVKDLNEIKKLIE